MIELLDWKRTHYSNEITAKLDGKEVIVMGWVRAIRDLKKLIFIKLADREGSVQIIATEKTDKKLLEKVRSLGREYVIAVKGKVKENKQAPNGFEIHPSEIKILNISEKIPMEVEDKKTPAALDTRLNERIIDLRKPSIKAIFDIQDTLKRSFFEYFDSHGFIDVNTPVITAAGAEGGATLFKIDYFGKKAYLNQSPQLYKQMMLSAGFDKITIVSHVFRAEPHETIRHINELVQMDMEMSFIQDEEDLFKHFDGYLELCIKNIKKNCSGSLKELDIKLPDIKFPIKRLTYDDTLKLLNKNGIKLKYGDDLTPEAEKKLGEIHPALIVSRWPDEVKPFYAMRDPKNEKLTRGFDLLLNGTEISSGAQREHRLENLIKNIKKSGLNPSDFEFYLKAFRYGMPPHGGWSVGLERLTMTLLGLGNIREASLFPRTKDRLFP